MIFSPIRFAVIYIAVSIAVPVVLYLIELAFGFSLSSSGVSILPYLAAALEAGTRHVNTHKQMPSKSDMWKGAAYMGLIGTGISSVFALSLLFISPEIGELVGSLSALTWVLIILGLFVFGVLISRLFVGLGARTAAKSFPHV